MLRLKKQKTSRRKTSARVTDQQRLTAVNVTRAVNVTDELRQTRVDDEKTSRRHVMAATFITQLK